MNPLPGGEQEEAGEEEGEGHPGGWDRDRRERQHGEPEGHQQDAAEDHAALAEALDQAAACG